MKNNGSSSKIPIRYFLIISTFLLTVLLYIDRACISTAKEDICSEFSMDNTQFGWIMAVFTLGYAIMQIPAGKFADKHGPREVLSLIIVAWSALTALTGFAWNYISMLVIRFLFGSGEAGAFPSLAKVTYNWFPIKERGIVQGINFSGSRIGAAFAMPLVAWMISVIGWKMSFATFGGIGILFALLWHFFFKNTPQQVKAVSKRELEIIEKGKEDTSSHSIEGISTKRILSSRNVWFAMIQYICSNFTFYFSLTWMFPYIREKFGLSPIEAGFYSAFPLIAGACGNWIGGIMVDFLYRKTNLKFSRTFPAFIGFIISAFGMKMVTFATSSNFAVLFLSLAVFGADMTLSPSWAFCIDIGKDNSGAVSGAMNMAGNIGAFITILLYPYIFEWTGSNLHFFFIASLLSIIAAFIWIYMNPKKCIK